jgi:GAF domain-containing protein
VSTRAREDSFLARIVATVGSSLELDEVLAAVVRQLTDASGVHACFVYLVEDDGGRLVLHAASEPYAHLAGRIELPRGEGLAWWAVEHREPAFVPDNLLADPRVKYVPELEEERFQSLLSVPIVGRSDDVIGVISAHTEAPREFSVDEVDFIVTAASLVAGAIENARLYREMQLRVRELEALTDLAEAIARTEALEELLPAVVAGARRLLDAAACHVYLIERGADDLRLSHSHPQGAVARASIPLAELGPELSTRARRGRVSVPLVADDELLGLIVADATRRVELARAIAGQVAVGIRKVRLIERLTERTLIADFFDQLARGGGGAELDGRAARLGCDLSRPHVVLMAEPPDERLESALAAELPGSILHRGDDAIRALVPVARRGADTVRASARTVPAALGLGRIGLSSTCADPSAYADGFEEARHALTGAAVLGHDPQVVGYDELGAHRYLLRIAQNGGGIRDATAEAVGRLAAYDEQRQTQLLLTLEEFLRRRGNISASAEALFVHPNTLRQRLRRIAELTDLDLRVDDWLEIEIAVKLVRLQRASAVDTDTTSRVWGLDVSTPP